MSSNEEFVEKDEFLQRLAESEKRLKEAERIAKLGSWELDLNANKIQWSDEIYRIFETDPDEFEATYEAFLRFVHPEDRKTVHEAFMTSIEEKTAYGPLTHRLQMKDGSIKYVEERGFTEYDEYGIPERAVGTVQDITERVIGEKARNALKKKEVLIREIYHRVKNNLQLVSGLIGIQSNQTNDPSIKEMFNTCRNRISTISLIHEQLYGSNNLVKIKIAEHIKKLLKNIHNSLDDGRDIQFEVEVINISIGMSDAVPLGLIINEIITNSYKYAFDENGGKIRISVEKPGDHWLLEISDNGKGVENVNVITESQSFGKDIVKSLVEQLNGEMEIISSPGNGVIYRILFYERD